MGCSSCGQKYRGLAARRNSVQTPTPQSSNPLRQQTTYVRGVSQAKPVDTPPSVSEVVPVTEEAPKEETPQ